MDILLSELNERTRDSLHSFELSPSTIFLYRMVWKALADYFQEHGQALFSRAWADAVCI